MATAIFEDFKERSTWHVFFDDLVGPKYFAVEGSLVPGHADIIALK